ncbi:MAG: tyrosine-protein phosphatase [Pseudomonadota bacterium]
MRKFLLLSASLLFVGACTAGETTQAESVAETPAEEAVVNVELASVEVVNGASNLEYQLSWEVSPAATPVSVEILDAADAPAGSGEMIGPFSGGAAAWTAPNRDGRRYFRITPEGGEAMVAATRLLPLEGGRNFRDMGGYETTDGRTVKWGKVFRSGRMSELTAADYRYLSDLGIKTLCDFRASDEREQEPTNWQAGAADYITFPDPDGSGSEEFGRALMDPNATPESVATFMADHYPKILRDQTPAYTEMFDQMAKGNVPLSFNCSAGKDRAGTAAALVLTALGVPRDTVIADYALSETYVDYMAEFTQEPEEAAGEDPYAFLRQIPREVLAPLMRSDPRYIQTTFDYLDDNYGSPMNFIQTELEVTDAELKTIRAALLKN